MPQDKNEENMTENRALAMQLKRSEVKPEIIQFRNVFEPVSLNENGRILTWMLRSGMINSWVSLSKWNSAFNVTCKYHIRRAKKFDNVRFALPIPQSKL